MSSLELDFSQLAQDDFRAILQFSGEQWGERQRDTFGSELMGAIHDLTLFPNVGRPRDDLKRGVRGLVVRDYLVLYQVTTTSVYVLRIIHTRRDPSEMIGL